MRLSEAIKKVMALAQARRAYWDEELPKRHADYPIINAGEDSGPPPPEEEQLRKFLARLPEDTVYQLLLILRLGRGAIGPNDLAEEFGQLKGEFADPKDAVAFLMQIVPLADYLADGLDRLSRSNIEVNKLLPKPAAPRR